MNGTHVLHQLRRAAQAPRAFSNWPAVLVGVALGNVGRGGHDLRFRTRDGLVLTCPNRQGARVPLFEIFAEDCYQLRWFTEPLTGRPVHVLDIGGHVGAFAIRIATLLPLCTVEAFEASPTTAAYLRRNTAVNGLADRVSVSAVALAGHSGNISMEDNGAGSALNRAAQGAGSAATSVDVPAMSFDDVVAQHSHPFELVKIDCEGAEYDFLPQSKPESWDGVERVILEYHPVEGNRWADLQDRFAALGFRVERDEPAGRDQGTAWLSR